MFLAAQGTVQSVSTFSGFDVFMIVFTLLIAVGLLRLVKAPRKNLFAIGFTVVALITFVVMDVVMIKGW